MPAGAGSTQSQTQAAEVVSINGKSVTTVQELQAALDGLAPGANVKIAFKSGGAARVIEGVVK